MSRGAERRRQELGRGETSAATQAPRRLRGNILTAVGGLLLGTMVVLAVFAPWLATADPIRQDLLDARRPPAWHAQGSLEHPLGTDFLGRDVWSRILHGARTTMLTSLAAALAAAAVGITLGLLAGYHGGWLDMAIMRLVDLMLAFPLIVLALALVAVLGPSVQNLVIALAATGWMVYARLMRAAVLSLKPQEFIQSAFALGASDVRVILRHILPNALTLVLVMLPLEIARIILTESALSFLGLGIPPPLPSWGRMLAESRVFLTIDYWIAVFPGLAIMVTVLGINFLGDGLRDLLDPRLRHLM
jgi:peptide/nickel transport system permease protein